MLYICYITIRVLKSFNYYKMAEVKFRQYVDIVHNVGFVNDKLFKITACFNTNILKIKYIIRIIFAILDITL